jgi:hypothetical protein
MVTHGHTWCTVERFEDVIKAVAECAFFTSELPVILSLEMHCSPKQQHKLAQKMVEHLGQTFVTVSHTTVLLHALRSARSVSMIRAFALPQYDELVTTGRATLLSPFDLQRCVLAKGQDLGVEEGCGFSSVAILLHFTRAACIRIELTRPLSNLQVGVLMRAQSRRARGVASASGPPES